MTDKFPDELLAAIARREPVAIEQILSTGVRLDAVGETNPNTPLICAADAGRIELVRALVEHGAHVDARGRSGLTALHHAAANDDESMVSLLLELRADANAMTVHGHTPLHVAAAWGALRAAERLLQSGADPLRMDADGSTPLAIAEEKEQDEVAQLLERAAGRVSSAPPLSAVPTVYRVKDHLQGQGRRRLWTAAVDGTETSFFVATNDRSSADLERFRREHAYELPGVLSLVHAGEVDLGRHVDDDEPAGQWGLVEAAPPGAWLPSIIGKVPDDEYLHEESRHLAPQPERRSMRDAVSLGLSAGAILASAAARGVLLVRVRPEYMWAERRAGELVVTGLTSRPDAFFALSKGDAWSPPLFDRYYYAPESSDSTRDDRALVFPLAIMVAEWATGRYPYRYKHYSSGPLGGEHLKLDVSEPLARLLSRGMSVTVADRPSLAQFLDELADVSASVD